MANRENTPTPFVLQGDVKSRAGGQNLTVQGFQNIPAVPDQPKDGQVWVYVASINSWVPADPVVSGTNTPGTSSTANPVQVAGIDEGNLVRELRTDTYGSLRSIRLEELMYQVLLELRAIKTAIISLDPNLNDKDFKAENFSTN